MKCIFFNKEKYLKMFLDMYDEMFMSVCKDKDKVKCMLFFSGLQTRPFLTPVSLLITPDRWQSKTLLTFDEHGSKIARNSVFDCHL